MFGSTLAITAGLDMIGAEQNRKQASKDRKMQMDLAKHGVSYRVNDAKAAGIHPLAALGISPSSASPVSVGSDAGAPLRKISNRLYDAQMQQAVQESNESRAKANYYNAMAEDIRKPRVIGGNLVGNEEIINGVVQNKPQTLTMPMNGTFGTGNAVPQERIEQEYGGIIGEGYGLIRAFDDAIYRPGIKHRDKVDKQFFKKMEELKEKAKYIIDDYKDRKMYKRGKSVKGKVIRYKD